MKGADDGAGIVLDVLTLNFAHNAIPALTNHRQRFWNEYPGWVSYPTTGAASVATVATYAAGGIFIADVTVLPLAEALATRQAGLRALAAFRAEGDGAMAANMARMVEGWELRMVQRFGPEVIRFFR